MCVLEAFSPVQLCASVCVCGRGRGTLGQDAVFNSVCVPHHGPHELVRILLGVDLGLQQDFLLLLPVAGLHLRHGLMTVCVEQSQSSPNPAPKF